MIDKIINVTEYFIYKLEKMDKSNPEYMQISEETNKLMELLNNENIIEELNKNSDLFEYIEYVCQEMQSNNSEQE